MRILRLLGGSFAFAGLLLFAAPASAHHNGHESRTVAECARLPTPERGHCEECVQRPRPHHFHPDYPAGKRCRPDNGKP